MINPIYVLSCGVDISYQLPLISNHANRATYVYGSPKLLETAQIEPSKRKIIDANAVSIVKELIAQAKQGINCLVLASGDALFHGIGGTRMKYNKDNIPVVFIPGPTAFQALFHKLNLAWDEADHLSVHNLKTIPIREILSSKLIAVYGNTQYTASKLAQACINFQKGCINRPAVIASDLGTDHESIQHGTLYDLSQIDSSPTSILLLLPPDSPGQMSCLPLGITNDFYDKENNLITDENIRSIVISKLNLSLNGTCWDIGAGSGSVGLEIAALCPRLKVYALEQKAERLEDIRINQSRLGVVNYKVFHGRAPQDLNKLPNPDRIFIGGGGINLPEILEACYERLNVGGKLVVSAVTIESISLLQLWNQTNRQSFICVDISEETQLSTNYHIFKPHNRIYIATYIKS